MGGETIHGRKKGQLIKLMITIVMPAGTLVFPLSVNLWLRNTKNQTGLSTLHKERPKVHFKSVGWL